MRLRIRPNEIEGSVDFDVFNDNGYTDDEIIEGLIAQIEEENVIWHVYIEGRDEERRVARFMAYWPL